MNTKLIRAKVSDAEHYVRIGKRTTSRFNRVTTDPVDAAEEIAASTTYLIEFDEQIVGFVSYAKKYPEHAYIAEVQVDPDFQGRGIGGFALDFILKEIGTTPIVDLHTHPENPAQRLYSRFGFEQTGEIIENYHDTGEPRMRMALRREHIPVWPCD